MKNCQLFLAELKEQRKFHFHLNTILWSEGNFSPEETILLNISSSYATPFQNV